MQRFSLIHLGMVLIALLLTLPACAAEADQQAISDTTRDVMEAASASVKPALVRIHVISVSFRCGGESKEEGYGSGIIISKEGYIITNHHVAGDAKYISCTLSSKEEIDAELIGTDPLTDIAVIKLTPPAPRDFPFANFGDSNALKVGERVLAMGSPLAFSQSVTMGVVSNTELVMPDFLDNMSFTLDGEDVGSMVRWIAHDADIFPGNSGGPLVNLQGKIVGINEISMALSGAIPGNLAKDIADQLIKNGKITRSWLGWSVQKLLRSSNRKTGVFIGDVIDGSPAQKAGLLPGDVLISLDGKPVEVHFKEEMPAFNQTVASLSVGKPISAVVARGEKEVTLTITPDERPKAEIKPETLKAWGVSARDITPLEAIDIGRPSTNGVRVMDVQTGKPAENAKPNLVPGDIITEIAGQSVTNIAAMQQITEGLLKGKTEQFPVLVAFDRQEEHYLTVVEIGPDVPRDLGNEVIKAWFPAGTQVLTEELALAVGLEGRSGVRITQIYPNTSVAKAGFKVGDIITAIDDTAVEATQLEDTEVLPTMVRQYKIGTTASFSVLRDKKELKIGIKLEAAPKPVRELKKYANSDYGFSTRDIAFMDRVRGGWPAEQAGVLVESVEDGGWACLGKLSSGDLICAVNGQPVRNISELEVAMNKIAEKKERIIVVQVKCGKNTAFLELFASWPK
ncbi:MAG: PDZ domain-containing protein [Armatimonadota bacterium]